MASARQVIMARRIAGSALAGRVSGAVPANDTPADSRSVGCEWGVVRLNKQNILAL